MSDANYLNMISEAAGNEIRVPEPDIIVLPETARAIQQNTEQLGAYLAQMGQIMLQMQNRLDELEEKQRLVTLNHDGVCDGCHMKQPPFVEQLVQHNKDLVACTMCGRILYRDL